MGIDGKRALVTGAGSGIGRATVRRLAAAGARVAALDLDATAARETVADLEGAMALGTDVSDAGALAPAVDEAVAALGGLDVVVNNAGIAIIGSVEDLDEATWDRGMDVNLKGTFLTSKFAWPHLRAAGGGAIVNVASVGALWAIPGNAAYCATKAGVLMLTKVMALDGARDNIRASAVCPGFVLTPMSEGFYAASGDYDAARREAESETPLGRLGTPEDVAGAIAYLVSPEAEWVSGGSVVVDGALTSGFWRG